MSITIEDPVTGERVRSVAPIDAPHMLIFTHPEETAEKMATFVTKYS